jgi:hypothetical protein
LKKALIVGAAGVAVAGLAGAQVIRCEQFNYPDGSLVPQGGWISHSGTAGTFVVTSGEAIVEHGAPSEDVSLTFTPISGNIYYALDFTVENPGSPIPGPDNEYFAHLKDGGFNFAARLDVVPSSTGRDYTVGIASDDSTADAVWPVDLVYGNTYRAVVRYDQDANIAELWIDPAVSTDTSILGDDKPDPGDSISAIALRQSDSDLNEKIRVDNVMVGYTFDDVLTTTATCGSQIQRFATTPNPATLLPGNSPDIGTTWNPTMISTGATEALAVSFLPGIEVLTSVGTFLCVPPDPALIFFTAPGTEFSIPIPNDPTLVGFPICTQGAGLGVSLELSNALDITLGG